MHTHNLGGHNLVMPAASTKVEKSFPYPIYAALTLEYLLLKRLSSPLPHNRAGYSMKCTAPSLASSAEVFTLRFPHKNGHIVLNCMPREALGEDVGRLIF